LKKAYSNQNQEIFVIFASIGFFVRPGLNEQKLRRAERDAVL
jgi:hypothetical protein